MRGSHLPLLALALGACNATSDGDGTATAADDTGTSAAVTWYRDVLPIVQDNCLRCHTDDGVAQVDFSTYEGAAPYAGLMAAWTEAAVMPPPVADPACRPYVGHDRMVLSDEQRALFAAWSELGAPAGAPADAPPAPEEDDSLHLADPDLLLPMSFAHTVDTEADGNEYRCFLLDLDVEEGFYITAFDVLVGDPRVAHHALLFRDTGGDAGVDYGATDPENGFDCRDPLMEDDWEFLHAWAPGMPATVFPDGVGLRVEEGDQLVLQMHYFDEVGLGASDLTTYALQTASSVDDGVLMYPVGPDRFTLPAGEAAWTETLSFENTYPVTLTVYGAFPHMHWLGTSYRAWLDKSDGTEECMVAGETWDFENQVTYLFEDPLTFAPGDILNLQCTWDNSAANPNQHYSPPQDISYGEGTNQEMCYFLMYFSY